MMRWVILVAGVGLILHACAYPDHWLLLVLGLCLMSLGLVLVQAQIERLGEGQDQVQVHPRRTVIFTVGRHARKGGPSCGY